MSRFFPRRTSSFPVPVRVSGIFMSLNRPRRTECGFQVKIIIADWLNAIIKVNTIVSNFDEYLFISNYLFYFIYLIRFHQYKVWQYNLPNFDRMFFNTFYFQILNLIKLVTLNKVILTWNLLIWKLLGFFFHLKIYIIY